jgi:uncharacterized membrane protein SpoIIM required for sporulation
VAIRQTAFEVAHAHEWERFERWLHTSVSDRKSWRRRKAEVPEAASADGAGSRAAPLPHHEVPEAYRRLCQYLALARERQYSADLIDRINRLVIDGHHVLYGADQQRGVRLLALVRRDFPREVRRQWRLMLAAALLSFGPMLLLIAAIPQHADLVNLFLAPADIANMEAMYSPGNQQIGMREASTNTQMFGFYIWNNVRIDFQIFASGITFGIGSVFFLVFNGMQMGAVAGHLTQAGFSATFWPFVSGHSSFELVAMVIAGAGGLKLGMAMIAPGRRRRWAALAEASKPASLLIFGAAIMTTVAALIEAFWSPHRMADPTIKYAVGCVLWCVVLAYLTLAGRDGS